MKKTKAQKLRRFLILTIIVSLLIFFILPFSLYKYINKSSEPYIYSKRRDIPASHAALVLGAQVYGNNRISHILYDRIISALELYRDKKVSKFILSGDHGRKDYDEVNTMKFHLIKAGVAPENIFLDHAGFDTYDSIIRAKKVFKADNIIIVTQRFHLPRAIFIARHEGLNALGYVADKRKYRDRTWYKIREMYARVKAFLEVTFGSSPRFLGKAIPVKGDGRKSWD